MTNKLVECPECNFTDFICEFMHPFEASNGRVYWRINCPNCEVELKFLQGTLISEDYNVLTDGIKPPKQTCPECNHKDDVDKFLHYELDSEDKRYNWVLYCPKCDLTLEFNKSELDYCLDLSDMTDAQWALVKQAINGMRGVVDIKNMN